MIPELPDALESYNKKWQALIASRTDRAFFSGLKPVSIGWKVDTDEVYTTAYQALRPQCDKIVETWMNSRWIAKMHLKNTSLAGGIQIIKLMQRRPGADDALGLDHLDFYSPAVKDAETILSKEPGLQWTRETNDAIKGYGWISVWFDSTEAKLKANTVLDIVIQELHDINTTITSE